MSDAPTRASMLDALQRDTFNYFVHEANPANGLIIDKTEPGTPASIAATGLALSSYPVGVERGFMTRTAAIERTLATLHFFIKAFRARMRMRPATRASTITFWT